MVARWPTSTDLQRLTKSYFYWDWRLRSPFYNENIVWENSIRYRMNENSTDEFNSPLLSSRGSAFWYRIYGLRTRLSAKSLSSVWEIKCSGRETSENSWKSHSGRAKKKKLFAREALREVMVAKEKKVTQLCLIHARSCRNEAGQTCLLCQRLGLSRLCQHNF